MAERQRVVIRFGEGTVQFRNILLENLRDLQSGFDFLPLDEVVPEALRNLSFSSEFGMHIKKYHIQDPYAVVWFADPGDRDWFGHLILDSYNGKRILAHPSWTGFGKDPADQIKVYATAEIIYPTSESLAEDLVKALRE